MRVVYDEDAAVAIDNCTPYSLSALERHAGKVTRTCKVNRCRIVDARHGMIGGGLKRSLVAEGAIITNSSGIVGTNGMPDS